MKERKGELGRRRVLADHSYQNRVEFIIDTLEKDGRVRITNWWKKHDPAKVIDALTNFGLQSGKILNSLFADKDVGYFQ